VKRLGLVFTTIILFALSLYVAYQQGSSYAEVTGVVGGHLAAPLASPTFGILGIKAWYLEFFAGILNSLTSAFGGSLLTALVVLALVVELITLYPTANIQLKQKKIHLFHKKLVDRFRRGDLKMSETKRELDVLYSVNERIHRRGALLVGFQILVFVLVLAGLQLVALNPSVLGGGSFIFNFALLAQPVSNTLPLLAALAYLLHSLIKIHVKQREDYISMTQAVMALTFALAASVVVYYFAGVFAVLLSVYFLTQITFATMRYIIIEENAKVWGKYAQKDLIKLLHTSKLHKNKVEYWSRKFNHLPIVRNINFHMLEEAVSMSLALVIALNGMSLM
jgi:hypothetical protein